MFDLLEKNAAELPECFEVVSRAEIARSLHARGAGRGPVWQPAPKPLEALKAEIGRPRLCAGPVLERYGCR